jgi:hypothetical protein
MAHKTYFAMPSLDYPPDYAIRIGQVITSPSEPWKPLAPPLPIPESFLQRTLKKDWGSEVFREREQRLGVWAQFAAMICGVGADAVVAWSRKNVEAFQFDELETTFFEPDLEYVQASVVGPERGSVADWVKDNRGKSVYMVTGVKVARGAQHLRVNSRGVDVDLKPGVDATPFIGLPLSGGPQVGAGRSKGNVTWFSDSSDFVFAYRLRRIIIKRRAVSKSEDYIKRATVAFEGRETSDAREDAMSVPTEVDSTTESDIQSIDHSRNDYGSGGYHLNGFVGVEVRDEHDGEECLLQVREDAAYAH